MGTSQRVSRGFHRLGLLLAAIPLLGGAGVSAFVVYEAASSAKRSYDAQMALVCAKGVVHKQIRPTLSEAEWTAEAVQMISRVESDIANGKIEGIKPVELRELGCTESSQVVPFLEVLRASQPAAEFNWIAALWPSLALGLGMTLVISLGIYGMVRAIGWVIGGFATS